MAMFTVRVELFGNAEEEDYEKLHKKMQAKEFFRVVQGESETWYHLPSAIYDHRAKSSASVVRAQVWTIAKTVWKDPGVLVVEGGSVSWKGLRKATAEEVRELTSVSNKD
jgi:hypothetical protein